MIIAPKNWQDFQHYKDRSPSWIKLHKRLLDNYEYQMLPVASRALAPMLWLLASEYHDAEIDESPEAIAFRMRMSVDDFVVALKPLINSSFFECLHDASGLLAQCLPREEKRERREEKSKSKNESSRFAEFWSCYPRKKNKGTAEKAWNRNSLGNGYFDAIMKGLESAKASDDWTKDDGKWIPYPATWLNAKGWEDEHEQPQAQSHYEVL